MDISKHIGTVRSGIDSALSLADDATKDVASRVASAAEPSLRLALIDAVSEAADEINEGLTTSHVTVAFSGGDPSFVVQDRPYVDEADEFELVDQDDTETDEEEDLDLDAADADETLVRFSLRLPKWAKDKVDDRAENRGMSTNAYLTEVIISEVAGRGWGPRGGGRERFGPGPGFGGPRPGPGKGWGPGSLLDPEAAGHIANVLSEVFGQDPRRRGGPGPRRPGGPHRGGPHDSGRREGGRGERGDRRRHEGNNDD